ncbi:hypothetical protein [Sporosarcina obsidiansis]|uniref:hypothetical protein n=1 Tax=Sporosarcina obsidiansis TaxID=2660748 RepID=UPI00129B6E11|nr:hypothetical protein [Sporosarcina obsidiansis]
MIRMHHLPAHIKQALQPYWKDGETPDVFPSIFRIGEKDYYFFTFAPTEEQLIIERTGRVPPFDEAKRIDLITTDFNHSIETAHLAAVKWVKGPLEENYKKLKRILHQAEQQLTSYPTSIQSDFKVFQQSVDEILAEQNHVKEHLNKIIEIWDVAKESELVTESDQIQARMHRKEMARAVYRQNNQQLLTEQERMRFIQYIKSKRSLINPSAIALSMKLKSYEKYMLNKKYHEVGMEELKQIVSQDHVTLAEEPKASDILTHLRNP